MFFPFYKRLKNKNKRKKERKRFAFLSRSTFPIIPFLSPFVKPNPIHPTPSRVSAWRRPHQAPMGRGG